MYLLDTNVVSFLDRRRREKSPSVADWIRRSGTSLFLSAMTIAELDAGLLKLRRSRQEKRADEIADLIGHIESYFGSRILPMNARVAHVVAELQEHVLPQVVPLPDLIIAATAKAHGHIVLTHNIRHFAPTGVPLIDPFEKLPPDAA